MPKAQNRNGQAWRHVLSLERDAANLAAQEAETNAKALKDNDACGWAYQVGVRDANRAICERLTDILRKAGPPE